MSGGFAAPPGPAERVRPATVSISSILLIVVAVAYVIGFIVAISIMGTVTDVFEAEFAGTEAEGAEGIAAGVYVAVAAVNLLIAIGLVVLAMLNNKGKNPSRIVTWVLGVISLCCAGFGLLSSGMNSSFGSSGDVDQEQLAQRLEDALPSWYEPVNLAILVVSILALAGAMLLLALPPSNEFFRKPQQPFEPPPPPPAYPQVG